MKRKVVVSMLILIIAIICCGCGPETRYKSTGGYPSYEHESDISDKKDEDDYSPEVYITKTGKRYHRFGCSHAKNLYVVLTVKQAVKKGYEPCYYCCF